jgi:AcrR family transcriptional regulator
MPGLSADPERRRIREAFVALVAEHGYAATTLPALLERAGVDHAAFQRRYADLDRCFAEIWEDYKAEFLRVTAEAFENGTGWLEGMRAAAWAFCRFLQRDHARARFFLVELNFAGEDVRASRDVVMDRYADLIDRCNDGRSDGSRVPRAQAEAIIGAIWEAAVTRVVADEFDAFPEAIPQGMYLTVFPYLGLEAAQEELRRGPEDIVRYLRGEL